MHTKISVLIVDDDRILCENVRRGLENIGQYTVHLTASGTEGFNLACELRPDIILLDMMLSGMTGAEVARMLRNDPATTKIPYIFLTGVLSEDDEVALGGIVDGERYLAKPANIEKIDSIIRAVLNR